MNPIIKMSLAAVALLSLVSCASLADRLVDKAVDNAFSSASRSSSSDSAPATETVQSGGPTSNVVDFKSGEILADYNGGDYYLASVLTPATKATKNQSEVIFISDGKKMWVNTLTPSHRATKNELAIGKDVFYAPWSASDETLTQDTYRKTLWSVGSITSLDYLYKNEVEINGKLCFINWVRIADK